MTGLVGSPRLLAGERAPLPPAEGLIEQVAAAGLRGRGGAWFPTATKLRAVASARRAGTVVANGVDGEPASAKDTALLMASPHLVLDGAVLAALAVGARKVIVCVRRGSPAAGPVLTALRQRADPVPVRLTEVPDRYVASEESALVNFLNTGEARPVARPPSVLERGVRGRPTLVDNVETLACIALIARHGADSFRCVGTAAAPGTMLLTVGGTVLEIPVGTTLDAVLGDTGPARAVLAGGFGGTWLPLPAAAATPLAPDGGPLGGPLGVGLVQVLPPDACGLVSTAAILGYLAGESAGQCGPCMFGLPAIARDMAELAAGGRPPRLADRLAVIEGRGACGHPDGAVRLARSALTVFADDVTRHAAGRPCGGRAGVPVPRPGVGWR